MSLAGVNCCSVPLTQHKQITQNSKVNIMAKKNVKVRDLKPSKDAKGGGGVHALGGGPKHAQGGGGVHASGGGPKHAQGGHGPSAGQ
jgi:hypothetical protein